MKKAKQRPLEYVLNPKSFFFLGARFGFGMLSKRHLDAQP
jgi:hypothetical protein